MPRISAGKKQSNTKRAIRDFKKWNEEKPPVFYGDGTQLILKDDEVFVPIYDFYQGKIKPSYYVSNYGNVLSFIKYGEIYPRVLTQNTVTGGYQVVGENWRVHKLVWFSFMADGIVKGVDLKQKYDVDVSSLSELKKLRKIEENKVHHIDTVVTNNCLSNLQILNDDIHNMLHKMNRADSEEKKWDIFIQNRDAISDYSGDKASIFFVDNEILAKTVEQQELLHSFSPRAIAELNELYWRNIGEWIYQTVLDYFDDDFFFTDKYAVANVKGLQSYFKYSMDGNSIKYEHITSDSKKDLIGVDFDIICNEGVLYFPNYVTDDD